MNRVRTASLVVVAVILGSLTATASSAAAYEPPAGAVFNNLLGNRDAKWRIVQTVNQAVKHTPKRETIQMSMYFLDSRASVDLLRAAWRRGVHVQLVLDSLARNPMTTNLAQALNRDNNKKVDGKRVKWGRDQSYVVFCKDSCRNGGVPNHDKYFTFTRTGTAKNVIMVSSSNLNKGGAVKGYNDLLILKDRPKLLDVFTKVHAEMAQDTALDHDKYIESIQGNAIARFYPKKHGADPVMTDLSKVHCLGARGGAGRNGHTAINISMFRWNHDRGIKIARRLVYLDNHGCDVSIIYGAPGRAVVDILKNSAMHNGVKLFDSRYDRNEDGAVDRRIHHKYMLINGFVGKDRSSWWTHTGSANWGQNLRAGDENTLSLESLPVYRQYMANWTAMRKASRPVGLPVTARLPAELV